MEGEQSLRQYSPELMVQDPNIQTAVSRLPPIILFHGTADYSIPSDARSDSSLKQISAVAYYYFQVQIVNECSSVCRNSH